MNKLQDKLKSLKVLFPLLLGTIRFRVKVFLRKIFNRVDSLSGKVLFSAIILVVFVFLALFLFLSSPSDFPVGTIFRIEQGSSLRGVSAELKDAHIIRSRLAFEALMILFGREKGVVSADYYFEDKLSVFEVARRIRKGEHHMAPIVVTIPEGFTTKEIADLFDSKLVNFDKGKFLLASNGLEGYLFPDTYFFLANDNESEVLASMRENFNKKIEIIRPEISAVTKKTGRSEKDLIIMASLVEGEAKGDADREFISGILWRRLSINMPLQVDVAPVTYLARGLPESPIGNPGMAAIKAAMYPKSSPYLYYLHDKDGVIHYARTFKEHVSNKLKYLTR